MKTITAGIALFAAATFTADSTRIAAHPAYTRVVVTFTGGTLEFGQVEASDPSTAGGAVRVRVRHPGVRAAALPASGDGVRAVVAGAPNRVSANLSFAAGRYKYLEVQVLHAPERLVLDLYRSRSPSAAAEVPIGRRGCLALTRVVPGTRSLLARGTERDLFEHSFLLRVRDGRGRIVGEKIMTAVGAWSGRVRYRVATRQRGTLEAVAFSAKDGALACLAQAGVTLEP